MQADKQQQYTQAQLVCVEKPSQNSPSPFTTFSLFYKGGLITHEILSEKKFEKILQDKLA